jgi:hypothetical protein
MRLLVVVMTVVALSGCASYVWSRPDATPEMLARDRSECEAEARSIARDYDLSGFPFAGWGWRRPLPIESGLQLEQDVIRRCMESRGYRLEKESAQRG